MLWFPPYLEVYSIKFSKNTWKQIVHERLCDYCGIEFEANLKFRLKSVHPQKNFNPQTKKSPRKRRRKIYSTNPFLKY